MKSLLFKEIKSFFSSPIGYLVMALFLVVNSLFLWVFSGDFNILDSGFADLSPFFALCPWILMFLIPAVTMKSFADEKKQGTIELLLTKPLSDWEIVLGKFFGAFVLITFALLPTICYVFIISNLAISENHVDFGSILGSYCGLLFLVFGYTSIGIFTSILTENQIVSFLISVFLCFVFYFGFEKIAMQFASFQNIISWIGMESHFKSISRGVIDSRDIIYFVSLSCLFLSLTVFKLKSLRL